MSGERFLGASPEPGLRAVAIGLGSNVETRIEHLRRAARDLERSGVSGARFSSVYETEPVHVIDQPRFLNACCVGWTPCTPLDLLDCLQALERAAGRDPRTPRFGPRELDLDILLFADEVVATGRLTVPHPRLTQRGFVLVPLAEVAGAWVHPRLGRSVEQLAADVDRSGVEATNLRLEPG